MEENTRLHNPKRLIPLNQSGIILSYVIDNYIDNMIITLLEMIRAQWSFVKCGD